MGTRRRPVSVRIWYENCMVSKTYSKFLFFKLIFCRKQCFVTKELVLRGQNGVRGVHVIEIVVAVFNFVVGNVKFQEEVKSIADKRIQILAPFHDNAQCPGPERETQPCNQHPCAPQCQVQIVMLFPKTF